MIISIVGKSGSGKSSIARYLTNLDKRFVHVDVDEISHYVLTLPYIKEEIRKSFGDSVIENGKVNRKALGNIVFASEEAMDELTRITWPTMESIIDKIIDKYDRSIVLLDWLLLPKTKFFEMSKFRIWVKASDEERFKRVMGRSSEGISLDYFKKRDKSGIDYEEGYYDFVIDNKDVNKTYEEMNKIYEKCIVSR